MKKLIVYITLSFITMFMSSCGGKTPSDILVGEWEIYHEFKGGTIGEIIFNEDGTLTSDKTSEKWKVHGKESLILTIYGEDGSVSEEETITIFNDDKIKWGSFVTLKRKNNVDKNN